MHFSRIFTIFQEKLHFRRSFLSNEYFYSFFNTLICLHSTITNLVISWRRLMKLIFLHFAGVTMWKVSKYGVFSGPHFPAFVLNMEIYGVNLRIQSEYRKIQSRKNSVFGHFSRSVCGPHCHVTISGSSCLSIFTLYIMSPTRMLYGTNVAWQTRNINFTF